MDERPTFAIGSVAVGLAALCCGLPILVVGLGAVGLTAWLSSNAAIAVPVLIAGLGLAWVWLARRRRAAGHCEPEAERQYLEKKDMKP
jgi:mercuric ion transport protein